MIQLITRFACFSSRAAFFLARISFFALLMIIHGFAAV